jgi:hypothetical protein
MNILRRWVGLMAVVAVAGMGQVGCVAATEDEEAGLAEPGADEDRIEDEFPATHELTAPSPQAITGCCIKCYNKPQLYSANQHQCYQQAVDLCDGWWNIKWAEKC